MVTVLREGGFRIAVYPDDHPPPHVHAYGDGEARITILTDPVNVLGSSGLTQATSARCDDWKAISRRGNLSRVGAASLSIRPMLPDR